MEDTGRPKTLLESIGNYKGLSLLGEEEIQQLCAEIRELIIRVTLKNGGHLGGSLGAVELCCALLRSFNPERDKIVFDVGHQTYAYKILTGRLDRFHTLRTKGGIAGFPRRSESPCDAFDVGHSSTSLSAALGFAAARDMQGQGHEVVAVIGDGALLNGLSLEALNNIGSANTKLVIILNDNKMSISPRVGGMAEHLAKLSVSTPYKRLKQLIKDQCHRLESGVNVVGKLDGIKTKIKGLLLPTNMFEAMDISYWGPFDGHNVKEMTEILELSKQYPKPLLIHVLTQKGKGCAEAEAAPPLFHGIGSGTVIGGIAPPAPPSDWSQAVSDGLVNLASDDQRVVVCTAAMEEGARLGQFRKRFPNRYFDVGIAEGHMLTFAAGLAAGGARPVVSIYSTFLQRAMDMLVHDISMQHHSVLLTVDRAGLTGEDGETHQGLLDLPWSRAVPGLVVGCPRDVTDLDFMMSQWLNREGPVLLRYPKGRAPQAIARPDNALPAPWGSAELLQEGKEICLAGIGSTVPIMLEAAGECVRIGLPAPTVIDLRFASPLDWQLIEPLFESHRLFITAEEGYLNGGVGEAIAAHAAAGDSRCTVLACGVEGVYVPHASRSQQMADYGLTPQAIIGMIEKQLLGDGDAIDTAASG